MIQVNLLGVIYSIEAVLPGMHRPAVSCGPFLAWVHSRVSRASLADRWSKAGVNAYMEGLRIALAVERESS